MNEPLLERSPTRTLNVIGSLEVGQRVLGLGPFVAVHEAIVAVMLSRFAEQAAHSPMPAEADNSETQVRLFDTEPAAPVNAEQASA
jgi:hypothetical protein